MEREILRQAQHERINYGDKGVGNFKSSIYEMGLPYCFSLRKREIERDLKNKDEIPARGPE